MANREHGIEHLSLLLVWLAIRREEAGPNKQFRSAAKTMNDGHMLLQRGQLPDRWNTFEVRVLILHEDAMQSLRVVHVQHFGLKQCSGCQTRTTTRLRLYTYPEEAMDARDRTVSIGKILNVVPSIVVDHLQDTPCDMSASH